MRNANYLTSEIKSRLTAKEVFTFYGISINSRGFCRCPFHYEKTASMKVYDGQGGYNCFGCHENGDVISFVQKYFGMSFMDSIKRLNEDFSLGLPVGGKIDRNKRREIARRSYELQKQRDAREQQKKAVNDEFWNAYDDWLKWDTIKRLTRPKDENSISDLFALAVHKVGIALERLERAEGGLYEFEKSNN